MDREQHEEWLKLRERGYAAVLSPEVIEFQRGITIRRLFQLVKLPSFSSCVGWEVFLQKSERSVEVQFFGVRKEWSSPHDVQKFESPVKRLSQPRDIAPTIVIEKFTIDARFVTNTVRALETVSIPIFLQTESVGLDGTSWRFLRGDSGNGVILNWWEDLPGSWKSASNLLKKTLQELESLSGH